MSLKSNTSALLSDSTDLHQETRKFRFEQDSFAFPNELYWDYDFTSEPGSMKIVKRDPPPTYAHHCFVLVRSARQFFFHARFEPGQALQTSEYKHLVRKIVTRSPRHASPKSRRVIVPGYSSLREFSMANEQAMKDECGGAWQSYFLRSHWRMVFPISRKHQGTMVSSVVQEIDSGIPAIVHVFRFPQLTINHGLLLFDYSETAEEITFSVYDPNIPDRPTELIYSHAKREFHLPRNHYWAGGRVDVVHLYRNWMY